MSKMKSFSHHNELDQLLHGLGLKTFRDRYQELAEKYEKTGKGYPEYLYELCIQESEAKDILKKERLLKSARMPRNKLLGDFNIERIKGLSRALVERLAVGKFMDTAINIMIFGKPGAGKTHLATALAREWCLEGRRVLYRSTSQIVEDLKKAQMENRLHVYLKTLDRIECLILDDISYLPWTPQDSGLLFQLISERYERRSLVITSNHTFSQWGTIFPDKMTAVAAIDRLVHHSEILELNVSSYREEEAAKRKKTIKKTD